MKKSLRYTLSFVIVTSIFYAIFRFMAQHVNQLKEIQFHCHYGLLAVSIFLNSIFIFNFALIWMYITRKTNCQVPLLKSVAYWMYSELGKYLPGRVFLLVGRLYFYKREGHSMSLVGLSFILEVVCSLLGLALFFLATFLFIPLDVLALYKPYVLVMLIAFFMLMHPRLLEYVVNLIHGLLKQEKIHLTLQYVDIVKIVMLYVLNYCVMGLAFFVFVQSLYRFPVQQIYYLASAQALAGMMGIVSVITPSGLGVREGVLVFSLQYIMPGIMAGIIALASRAWMIVTEVLVAIVIFLVAKGKRIDF